ncbi:MAG TPA: MXAN_5187 family protein [Polyangiales bacterium]
MLLSRFWYLFLAVSTAAATGAALLAQGIINDKATEQVTDQLRRDRVELDAMLRLEARARLDRIGFITVDSKLGSLLKQAANVSDEKQLGKLSSDTKEVLRSHVARLIEAAGPGAKEADVAPDIAFALDSDGRIIAQLGPLEANPPGSSLATYPLVDRALHGYVRDDVWVYDRRIYRMAARPVLSGGEYVGAIVHGYRFDNAVAEKLSQGLGGVTLAFFYGTNVLASYAPDDMTIAPPLAEVEAPLSQVLTDERWKKGESTEPYALASHGRALYSLIVGGAAAANVGYVIGRPLHLIAQPQEIFQNASQQQVHQLPLPILGGGAAALALIGLMFVYFERDRPYKVLLKKIGEITQGERDRLLVTEWRGLYRKLTDQINQAIDKSVEKSAEMAPTTKKKANLDEILGPTPQTSSEPYFGFAADSAGAAATPAAKPAAAAPPKPAAAPKIVPAATPMPGAIPAARPMPLPVPPKPVPATTPAPGNVSTASMLGVSLSPEPDEQDEDAHFRETYDQYIVTRQQCGEPTEGLSYEKFEVTLIKTRDQVVAKHGAKGVRFSVYVKEGKAALKASALKN